MKKKSFSFLPILLFVVFLSLFVFSSCQKQEVEVNIKFTGSTELWLKVSPLIDNLEVKFVGYNASSQKMEHTITYANKVFVPNLGTMKKDNELTSWTQVYGGSELSNKIIIVYKNVYEIRGFSFGEKRMAEIILNLNGSLTVVDHDIDIINHTVIIE